MDRLILLSQDKATLADLRAFAKIELNNEIIDKVLKKEDVSGYPEAEKLINKILDKVDKLYKNKKSQIKNQNE